jgi:hypothetical protein
MDWSLPWRPESKFLMDIPTALNFFYEHRYRTKQRIGEMARKLVAAWNKMYYGSKTVIRLDLLVFKK